MLIALHDADKEQIRNKKFPNYALMKISAYHKAIGDAVEWLTNGKDYDKTYSSKIFDFTTVKANLPKGTIKGGTGYDVHAKLPPEIDDTFPDYSIYPECDYAVGFITRGCTNNCPWCYVPTKEGKIKPYRKWQELVRPDSDKLVLMDNNILASNHGIEQLQELTKTKYKIDLNQGMDIRLVTEDVVKIIKELKWLRYIRFSCDTFAQVEELKRVDELFIKYKVPRSRVFLYLLVRKDLADAERRAKAIHGICKSYSIYAQAERNQGLGIIPSKLQLEFAQRYMYSRNYKKYTFEEHLARCGKTQLLEQEESNGQIKSHL